MLQLFVEFFHAFAAIALYAVIAVSACWWMYKFGRAMASDVCGGVYKSYKEWRRKKVKITK